MIKYNNEQKVLKWYPALHQVQLSGDTTESASDWHFLLPQMVSIAERNKEKDNEQCIQESVRW